MCPSFSICFYIVSAVRKEYQCFPQPRRIMFLKFGMYRFLKIQLLRGIKCDKIVKRNFLVGFF